MQSCLPCTSILTTLEKFLKDYFREWKTKNFIRRWKENPESEHCLANNTGHKKLHQFGKKKRGHGGWGILTLLIFLTVEISNSPPSGRKAKSVLPPSSTSYALRPNHLPHQPRNWFMLSEDWDCKLWWQDFPNNWGWKTAAILASR